MRRPSFPFLVIATVLALLLPLEQAHCLWMGIGARPAAASAMMAPDHSCCRGHAAAHGRPATPECACLQLPTAAVPHALVVATPRLMPATFAILISSPGLAPAAEITAPLPAPDVGGAPPPVAPRALAARAPPRCA